MNFLCMLNADLNYQEKVYDYHHINTTVEVNDALRKRLRGMPYIGSIPGNITEPGKERKPPANLADISFYIDGLANIPHVEDRFVEIGIRVYPEAINKLKEIGKVCNGRTILTISLNLEERPSGTEGIAVLAIGSATISKEGQHEPVGLSPDPIEIS